LVKIKPAASWKETNGNFLSSPNDKGKSRCGETIGNSGS
jgi:hypothetical protein